MKSLVSLSLIGLFALTSCGPKIIQSPIVFDQQRKELSLAYMKSHYGMEQSQPTIVPRMVVVHWTAIPTYEKTFEVFDPTLLPSHRTAIAGASPLNVSSQYVIDRDGSIHQLLPDTIMARHVIGLNHCAIGIENIGGPKQPLTKAQLKANTKLIKQLKKKYPIDYVIGHYEYTLFESTDLWKEIDEGYRTQKTDPGEQFMKDLRSKLESLDLKPLPAKS
ncbi:N-acetylmuramoyl-L-alanine amidase [Galbibacter sp.]|uniref:N-acetylmuramoyl-L-alanine amidase n=1 Tax=Galbibacter sp. TaxID=2918471 RepID=UPI003A916967